MDERPGTIEIHAADNGDTVLFIGVADAVPRRIRLSPDETAQLITALRRCQSRMN
jgi:hypothetical protein